MNRADLTDDIPTYIQLAEATIRRTLRTKHKATQTINTVADTGEYTLDSDVIESYSAYVTSPLNYQGSLDSLPRGALYDKRRLHRSASNPRWINIVNTSVLLAPIPNAVFIIEILQEVLSALSDVNTTNYILLNYPDVYLYGALVHSAPFLKEDERVQTWQGFFKKALRELEVAQDRNEYPKQLTQQQPVNLAPTASYHNRGR